MFVPRSFKISGHRRPDHDEKAPATAEARFKLNIQKKRYSLLGFGTRLALHSSLAFSLNDTVPPIESPLTLPT